MRVRTAAWMLTLGMVIPAEAQTRAPEQKTNANIVEVVVTGCLRGDMLVETARSENEGWYAPGQTFRLKASKSVMRALKAQSDYLVEVRGTVDRRQLGDGSRTGGVPIGKGGRLVFGAREAAPLAPMPFSPTLPVERWRALAQRCQ